MIERKLIAQITRDFYALYLGKSMMGIKDLLKKYEAYEKTDKAVYKLVIRLISNLNTTIHVDMDKAMHEIYAFFKKYYENVPKDDKGWERVIEDAGKIGKKYENSDWCRQFLIELMSIIELADKETREKADEKKKAA